MVNTQQQPKKYSVGLGESFVYCLPRMHEDLSSYPSIPTELDMAACNCTLGTGKAETDLRAYSLASLTAD